MKCWDQNPENRPTFEEITKLLMKIKKRVSQMKKN